MRAGALWRLRPYVRPYRKQMLIMLGIVVVAAIAGALIPLVTRRVVDGPIATGNRSTLYALVALALALGFIDCGLSLARRWINSGFATGLETDLRNDLYAHLQKLPPSFHDEWQTGQLLSRAMTDIGMIRRLVGFGLVFLAICTATLVMVLSLLLVLYWPLAVVTAVALSPIFWISLRFQRRYAVMTRAIQDKQGDLTTVVEEAAIGIRTIKAFGRSPLVSARYASTAADLRRSALEAVGERARTFPLFDLVPMLALTVAVLGGALAVGRGALTIGGLVAFVTLVLGLVFPIDALGWILANTQESATAAARIYEIFDTEPAIADRPGAIPLASSGGHVRFEGVGFSYDRARPPILHDVSLAIEPGETLALVGRTGSGKTTLAMLIPRLTDVTEGRVLLDGHDVRDITLRTLRSHVAVAFEDPLLFSASVRENMLYGRVDATDVEIVDALDVACAGFVLDLPWGLDTRVGEQGLSLSGGQRQRIALARAVLSRPSVLVLDDPLSALDVHTEAIVEEALRRVLHSTTGLVIAHRPSTLALADRVAFLDGGTIVATGSHSHLLATVPEYRDVLAQEADLQPLQLPQEDLEDEAVA